MSQAIGLTTQVSRCAADQVDQLDAATEAEAEVEGEAEAEVGESDAENQDARNPDDQKADAAKPLTPEQQAELDRLVEELSSSEFAQRERAAGALMAMGLDVVEPLRQLQAQTTDAEVRLRAGEVVRQLTDGDLQTRIKDFLAGKEVDFDGWEVIRAMLGDNGTIRELFIELTEAHPALIASMEGTTRDRVIALEKALVTVQQRVFVERKFPSRADTFALVLPTVDANVPVTAGFESVVLSTLLKTGATEIRQNPQLLPSFRALLGRWMIRGTLSNRIDVLLSGMAWEVDNTLSLAVATLTEANDTETLAVAMQAIARFGSREHAVFVRPLLEDSRPSSETGFADGKLIRTEIRDVAMATIAVLYNADLAETGFGSLQTHPTYGFVLGDIGFPVDDDGPRKKTREKIDRMMSEKRLVEES
ncbi:MAG: hypothetical protein WBD31_30875 [Rubripirellula sp.]